MSYTHYLRGFMLGLILVSSPSFALNENPQGKTIDDCFRAALARSETVGMSLEVVKQAEENYNQAIGAVLPNISGIGGYQWQQNNPNPAYQNIYPNPSSSARLTVTQPLFQGFKEFAGLRQTKTLVGASVADKNQATTQLYLDTAASYFQVVMSEQDIDNITEELSYYDKRIAELHGFEKIGRSQVTDVLTAQSQQAALKAQMKSVQGQLRAQRAVLAFLTGFDPDEPVFRPAGEDATAKTLDTYLGRVDSRPDVQGDTQRAKAADDGIPIARSGHFPTLGVQGDYYLERTGALKDVNWDVMLNLTVPIFSGGMVQSQVEEAVSKRDQAELQVSRTKRLAVQQIRQYYESYIGDRNEWEAYKEATDLAEKNYKAETRNYRLGLVTNLDVLSALTTFEESKRSLDKARFSMLNDIENLEAAGGFKPHVEKTASK